MAKTLELAQNIKRRYDHNQNKIVLKEKYHAKMIFSYNDGMWEAGPQLLNILNLAQEQTMVLLDNFDTPIMVDVHELRELAYKIRQEQMNQWQDEWNQIRIKR